MTLHATDREVVIRRLADSRPRSRFLWWSGVVCVALVIYAWTTSDFRTADFVSARRLANVQRFVSELRPVPLQTREWDSGIAVRWLVELMSSRAGPAALTTLAMSIAAIVLAALGAAVLTLPATRSFAAAEPYGPDARPPSPLRRIAWGACVWTTRAVLIFLRAVPEYMWAFVVLAVLGPNVWAAVLALALHNGGVLGKLNAEVVENLEPQALAGLRALGATRLQMALAGVRPLILPRFLLFFFYRWETCVREATVLGMLGIVSLGWYIQDARARQYYDVMLAFILVSAVIVMIGDVVSATARAAVRKSS